MNKRSICLKVPKIYGERTIALATKLNIVNKELQIQNDEKSVYIPLTQSPKKELTRTLKKQVKNLEVTSHLFPKKTKHKKTLAEILKNKLPLHLHASLPHSADIIGDIMIVEIPKELDQYKTIIGEALSKTNKNVKTVLAKESAIGGTYRLRKLGVIAGETRTTTIHKEHGCKFYVDVAKAYFSPRLSFERKRVASAITEGETIIDLFTGVGPFAILIAKTHENVKIYAIDVNPFAVEFLEKNIKLNRVYNKVYPILGDSRQIVEEKLSGIADRVIMNLPEKSVDFVSAACMALKPRGGTVHFYGFINESKSLEALQQQFTNMIKASGRKVKKIFSKPVRQIAPHEWQVALDTTVV